MNNYSPWHAGYEDKPLIGELQSVAAVAVAVELSQQFTADLILLTLEYGYYPELRTDRRVRMSPQPGDRSHPQNVSPAIIEQLKAVADGTEQCVEVHVVPELRMFDPPVIAKVLKPLKAIGRADLSICLKLQGGETVQALYEAKRPTLGLPKAPSTIASARWRNELMQPLAYAALWSQQRGDEANVRVVGTIGASQQPDLVEDNEIIPSYVDMWIKWWSEHHRNDLALVGMADDLAWLEIAELAEDQGMDPIASRFFLDQHSR